MFSSQIIVDLDETEHGWEVVGRLGPEDLSGAVTNVPEHALADAVHAVVGASLLDVLAMRAHERNVSAH